MEVSGPQDTHGVVYVCADSPYPCQNYRVTPKPSWVNFRALLPGFVKATFNSDNIVLQYIASDKDERHFEVSEIKGTYNPGDIVYTTTIAASAPAAAKPVLTVAKAPADSADQIHWTIISDTGVTFDWIGAAEYISYGTEPNELTSTVSAEHPAFLPVTSPWHSNPGPFWEAKITGLKQNSRYYYRIGGSGQVHRFRTPPPAGTGGFRVCSTSDMHSSSRACVAMFNQIAGLKPDIVITTGDTTGGDSGGQAYVDTRFHEAMVWSQDAAWMPIWGNHDWEDDPNDDDLRSYKGRFDIPNQHAVSSAPAAGCCGEDWGWFDYGNTRFISYPERYNGSTWTEWQTQVSPVFSAAQNDPNIRFIITFGHRSAYTSTHRRSPGETDLRAILDGFHASYSEYKLDLSGHNHQYERYQLSNGMTYIVNSTGGSYYHEGWDSPTKPTNCAYRAIHYGILVLDISDTAIQFVCSVNTTNRGRDYMLLEEPVCSAPGEVIDSFTIVGSND